MTATRKNQMIPQFDPQTVRSGDYAAQRQLDFRLVRGQSLEIVSPFERATELSEIERDFQIAAARRDEPEGATLAEMGKKYDL
jgi:hypothetical protein